MEVIEGIALNDSLQDGNLNKKLRLKAMQAAEERALYEKKNKKRLHYVRKDSRTWKIEIKKK